MPNPKTVLEIGIGNGFVSKYLKEREINVVTLDLDKRLNPNVAGSVMDIPFPNESFEVVACYELLEHLPYEGFKGAILEIFRVSNSYTLLSLPDASSVYRLYGQIPRIGQYKKLIQIPSLRKPINRFDGQHYWEIGRIGYPLNRITNDIINVGFNIKKTYRVFEMPYHRFFILEKTK